MVPLHTNLLGEPTADVPGLPGVHFRPGTGSTHFDRPFGSPSGHWAIVAFTDLATSADQIILFDDQVVAHEGSPVVFGSPELCGPIDQTLGVDDFNTGGVIYATNTDAPDSSDEVLALAAPSFPGSIAVREGQVAGGSGETIGSILESPRTSRQGDNFTISLNADLMQGVPGAENDWLFVASSIVAKSSVTFPPGQLDHEPWENFDTGALWVTPDSASWLVQGDLAGSTTTDDVVAVDGAVVVQEGVILAGTAFTEPVDDNGIVGVHMAANGRWFVRGNNDTTEADWIYSNGAVLAARGQEIFPGSPEHWSDTEFADLFFLHVGNGHDHFVIGGVTDGLTNLNGVLVLDNEIVLAREEDPVDLDGDGIGDGYFIDAFGNDDGYLSDEGDFYFAATVQDVDGISVGQGLFRIDLRCRFLDLPFSDGFESGDSAAWIPAC
ncbi:MAG: hypothetical protein ABI689_15070 [Thermoanaerobaculia bacterium]